MDQDEYRRTSLEAWEMMADGWERWGDWLAERTRPVTEWMVRELDPVSGETILELAAGPGGVGFEVADRLGENGRLITTDFSEQMVEVARRRGDERGLDNVDYRVMDAENIELDDEAVDGVLCRFGYMLMADQEGAFRETRRVLRPGGRLVMSVWGSPEDNPWAALGALTLVEQGHMDPPDPDEPGVFSLGDPERIHSLLEEADFEDVRTEEVPVRFTYSDVEEYERWAQETAGPFAEVLHGLSEEEREAMRERLREVFEPFREDGGYAIPGVALAAAAS